MVRWKLDATHCQNGHPLVPENIGTRGSTGRRYCITCRANKPTRVPPNWKLLGVSRTQGERLLRKQRYRCAICGKKEKLYVAKNGHTAGRFHLDHDHKTGDIRGFLCPGCNTKLGWLEGNLTAVLQYLGIDLGS